MDEFYREQRTGPGRQLLDLVCVALLGLILTLAAGAISRAPVVAAHGPGADAHGKAAADCDTPAKPEPALVAALPAGAVAIAPCADGTTPAAPPAH